MESQNTNFTKILIVEDEILTLNKIKRTLYNGGFTNLKAYQSGEEAIKNYEDDQPQLMIIDVKLRDGMGGVELVKKLIEINAVPGIFLTGFIDDIEVKGLKDFLCINKPYNDATLLKNVELLIDQKVGKFVKEGNFTISDGKMNIPTEQGFSTVTIDEIRYIAAERAYCNIYLNKESGKRFEKASKSMNYVRNILMKSSYADKFMKVHRSHFVNCDYVEEFDGKYLYVDGEKLEVSRSNKKAVRERFL